MLCLVVVSKRMDWPFHDQKPGRFIWGFPSCPQKIIYFKFPLSTSPIYSRGKQSSTFGIELVAGAAGLIVNDKSGRLQGATPEHVSQWCLFDFWCHVQHQSCQKSNHIHDCLWGYTPDLSAWFTPKALVKPMTDHKAVVLSQTIASGGTSVKESIEEYM